MSYNIINCFLKDSKGMLWIGTYNGLNKYYGAHFYIYQSGPVWRRPPGRCTAVT